jgi:hypothetical protein
MAEPKMSFEGWAIVELFGHQQIAGFLTEQSIGGASFVRVDVPAVQGAAEFTKMFGAGAIYAITPTTEEVAALAAEHLKIRPVSPWIVPVSRRIEPPVEEPLPGMYDSIERHGPEWYEDEEDLEEEDLDE